jgi:hypothetical protein
MGCSSGAVGTGRRRAAGAGRRVIAGRERTIVPGVKEAPCLVASCSCATRQPRWGPVTWWPVGRPQGRLNPPSGRRMTQEANAGGRKAAGNRGLPSGRPASCSACSPTAAWWSVRGRCRACGRASRTRSGWMSWTSSARYSAARSGSCCCPSQWPCRSQQPARAPALSRTLAPSRPGPGPADPCRPGDRPPAGGWRPGRPPLGVVCPDVTRPAEHVAPQMLMQRCDTPLLWPRPAARSAWLRSAAGPPRRSLACSTA